MRLGLCRMTDTTDRLASCFANVFPQIAPGEIPKASIASLGAWDSLAHVTLLSAIAEEFQVEFAPEDFEELTSFLLIADRLENGNHE